MLSSLFNHSWIDHQTRAVFAEFTVYNPNINLFTSVQLLTEFPPVGAAVTYTSILTFRLYQYLGAYGTIMILAQVITLCFKEVISEICRLIPRKKTHDPYF